MTGDIFVFICVLIINAIIVLGYILWNILCLRRENQKVSGSIVEKRRGFPIRAAVMLLCPVAGPLFFLFAQLWYKVFFSKPVDLEDVVFSKERVRTFIHAEEERERNMVPLEEAIEITDTSELRKLMMNVVRGDIHKSLASIALALNSADTETAHYAASVLQDALNDFRINVQKQRQIVLDGGDDAGVCSELLIEYMNQVLEQRVFNDMEQKTYVEMLDEICDIFYERDREHMTSSQFEAVTLRLLEVEDYDNCRKWCDRAEYHFPNTLATYTCQLKLYFNSGQKKRFFEVIDELKKSAVVVDSETLELLRVFR
ncbi:MAG: hypothetical protein LUG83_06290 [Lachnospiraceae bacterium]|nr:hypothetical protein [Lachnospiraceae bacterium]